MRRILLYLFGILFSIPLFAQSENPVVMKVNGTEVRKTEFEYFYRKNNTESVTTKKTLKKYADMYLDFKLKVQAAVDEGIDKSEDFLNEFHMYRDMQAEYYLVDNLFLDDLARQTYAQTCEEVGPDGMAFLLMISAIPPDDRESLLDAGIKGMNEEVYPQLVAGANFRELAKKYSNDGFAADGGEVGWVTRDQLIPEVADVVFSLEPGQFSKPFVVDGMVFIAQVERYRHIGSFEDERPDIDKWIRESGNYTEAQIRQANYYASLNGWKERDQKALAKADSLLEEIVPEFGNISREYHDGLLVFDITNKEVWEKAANDPEGMEKWFNANRKQFAFEKPCFKGLVFFCLDEDVFRNVESAVQNLPFENWLDTLFTFNREKVQVRVMRGPTEKGIFSEGDNAYVDHFIFGKDEEVKPIDGFPYVNVLGKVISKPEHMNDVSVQVVEGYQDYLEKQWVKKLRKQYKHKIYRKALKQTGI
jgi:peptidyl-prolyl cis-trans isomerase SurA